jgi:hypothetical protein
MERVSAVRLASIILVVALVFGCSDRPSWADGRMVREKRPANAPAQSLANMERRLLAIHNRARTELGAPPLLWDSRLARAAASYGPQLAARGRLAHSAIAARPGQGENLWMGTRGAYSIEEMAGGWAAEKSLFRPGIFPDVSRNGKWGDVAHYTQIIWRGTTRVGCAIHKSRDWDFLICRYAPPGNVVGQRVP